jgi:hypothetical protein
MEMLTGDGVEVVPFQKGKNAWSVQWQKLSSESDPKMNIHHYPSFLLAMQPEICPKYLVGIRRGVQVRGLKPYHCHLFVSAYLYHVCIH